MHDTAGDKARVYRCGLLAAPALNKLLVRKNILREPCLQVNAEIIDVYELKKSLCRVSACNHHIRGHKHDRIRIFFKLTGCVISEKIVGMLKKIIDKLLAHILQI